MTPEKSSSKRPYNAEATRMALLSAARVAFARKGFDQVGLREIAAEAGVNAALVIRYFESKEKLFAQTFEHGFSIAPLLLGSRSDLGEQLACAVLQKDNKSLENLAPLLALLRSTAHEGAAALLRSSLDQQFIQPLADWLGGSQARQRAGLIAAYLLGLTTIRSVLQSQALNDSSPQELVALAAPVLQHYIDFESFSEEF